MKILVNGKIRELNVLDTNGTNWTADFIESAYRKNYNEEKNAYIMAEDDYKWWKERIKEKSKFETYCTKHSLPISNIENTTSYNSNDLETFYTGMLWEAKNIYKGEIK